MKKSLLTIVLAMAAMVSSAQIYVGGSLGFSSASMKASYEGESYKESASVFSFSPEVGYNLNETLGFGAAINLNFSSVTAWNIMPYARYTFHKVGNVSCFADGVLGFGNDRDFSIAVRPGLAVNLTDNISIISTINLLDWSTDAEKEDGVKFSASTFNIIGGASVGVYYTF